MLRKFVIVAAFAALVAVAAASAAPGSQRRSSQESSSTTTLMPGVTYTRAVDFTSRGPIVIDVVTAPKPDGSVYSLGPVVSNGTLRGTDKLTHLERQMAGSGTTVAIDGDYFDRRTGAPSGIVFQGGVLESQPVAGRSSLGIGTDGTLTAARVAFAGAWQGNGQRRPLFLNTPKGRFTLYTPAYGNATPGESGAVEAVIGSFPQGRLDQPLDGTVNQVANGGPTRIPPGGAVLVARGALATSQLRAEAPVGQQVDARLSLSPDWSDQAGAIGGGPLLVKNGKPVFHANESFAPSVLNHRQARGAVGQLADGRILLVSVEGTNPAYSIGMSSYELAVELSRLGARTAYGLDSGAAAGMAFDGRLLTRPSSGREAKLSDALALTYSGVYALPPSAAVLSPNGDGIGDTEALSFRVVRPSDVSAVLTGPRGVEITLVNGAVQPGPHSVAWDGRTAGTPAPEGQWTFAVTATDDRNVKTTAQRSFSLDDTLSSLTVSTSRGRATASFRLARAARVVVRVERRTGSPVATLLSGQRASGPQRVTWKGRIGRHPAPAGRYQLAVQSVSSVGASSLTAPFSFRPHTRH